MKKSGIFLCSLLVLYVVSLVFAANTQGYAASKEETIAGLIVKTDKGIVVEADDGNYIIKGQDLSKMLGKLVEITGIITETDRGDFIDVKSYEELQE